VAACDPAACARHVPRLAGLGPGLTPAGDDFLVGAILGAWILHPQERARSLAGPAAEAAARLTSTLSAAWLRWAGRGAVGETWQALFRAVLLDDRRAERSALDRILATGHTSGADALAGFVAALRAGKDLESSGLLSDHVH
jgi:hypothetical protein